MKAFIPFLMVTAIAVSSISASEESPGFAWAVRGGGDGNDKVRGICSDTDGSIFVTGEITGEADFGGIALPSVGELDFMVAKMDPAGKVLWAARAGGARIDRGYGVSPDGQGGCFVTGHFQSDSIRFGDFELANSGDYDFFVARFDAKGDCRWAVRGGGAGYDYGHGIATDSKGNAVMSGAITGTASVGDNEFGESKGRSVLLAKYDSAGKAIWVRTAGGSGGNSGHNVCVGPGDAIYVCGLMRGDTRFDAKTTVQFKVQEAFLARYDSEGSFQWVRDMGGESNGLATGVAADESGRVYITGMFQGKVRQGDRKFSSRGGHDFYVAGFTDRGDSLWLHTGGGLGTDYGLGISAMPGGGCAVTGEITERGEFAGHDVVCAGERDAHVTVLDFEGEVLEFSLAGGVDHDLSYAITATVDGAFVIAGAFRNETMLGDLSLKSRKGNDLFVAKRRSGR